MVLVHVLGAILFLYVFWRRLKDDYSGSEIFTTALFALFGVFLTRLLSKFYFPDWWFWANIAGISFGVSTGVVKEKLQVVEVVEATIIALVPWMALGFLGDSILNSSAPSFMFFLVHSGLIYVFYFLEKSYKDFSWYKSGRIGFSGFAVAVFLFLIRTVVGAFNLPVFSLSPYDAIISGVFTVLSFSVILFLGRKQ